jgi:hypothetical protein
MRLVAVLGVCLAVAGCAPDVIDGTARPGDKPSTTAPTTSTPALVPTASLNTLPLKRSQLGDIVGDTNMTQVQEITRPSPQYVAIDPIDCKPRALPAETGLGGKAVQGLVGNVNRGEQGQAATQIVAIFDNRQDASQTIDFVRANWQLCRDGQRFTIPLDGGVTQHWIAREITSGDSRIGSTMTREEPPPRTCHHVMAAKANVVVETIVCGDGDTTAAANEIADQIVAKVPQ